MDVLDSNGKPIPDFAKPETLWSIEVLFLYNNEMKLHKIVNVTNSDLMKFRTYVFSHGLMYPIDPGHWLLVPPFTITSIDVFKQNKRFTDF